MDELCRQALARLREHWGREYRIDYDDGEWTAWPWHGDRATPITAETDELMHLALRSDYCAKVDAERNRDRVLRSAHPHLFHA
jgi:hypothetical protein